MIGFVTLLCQKKFHAVKEKLSYCYCTSMVTYILHNSLGECALASVSKPIYKQNHEFETSEKVVKIIETEDFVLLSIKNILESLSK